MFDKIKNFLKGFSKEERLRKKEFEKQIEKVRRLEIYSKAKKDADEANERMQQVYCPIRTEGDKQLNCTSRCIHFRKAYVAEYHYQGYHVAAHAPRCALWKD